MQNYQTLTKCVCCDSPKLTMFLDLKDQPLANSYQTLDEIYLNPLEKYPLQLMVCNDCFHVQLSISVDRDLLFKKYLYVSGTTHTLRNYFESFFKLVKEENPWAESILDIASNDGSLLIPFKQSGWEVQGIDPAENLRVFSNQNNIPTIVDYFENVKLEKTYPVIVAQNVFAHVANPLEFLKKMKESLYDRGKIYIQTSQANYLDQNQFDYFYHEHISAFNIRSMRALANKVGLDIQDVRIQPIHGDSYLFTLVDKKYCEPTHRVLEREEWEKAKGYYFLESYERFSYFAHKLAKDLKQLLLNLPGQKVGYGAAAKGCTLLNFAEIDLDCVVDDNHLKWDHYIPGREIKILPPYAIKLLPDFNLIPLSWNFFGEIKKKTQELCPHSRIVYVRYFPQVKTEL